jgi:phage-related protein (TIGR01555 family)
MVASDEVGGRINPDNVDWELQFNPLWNVDQETDAKIRKMNAEIDEIYITAGVLDPDQVRETRFGIEGTMSEELKTDGLTPEELAELAEKGKQHFEDRK